MVNDSYILGKIRGLLLCDTPEEYAECKSLFTLQKKVKIVSGCSSDGKELIPLHRCDLAASRLKFQMCFNSTLQLFQLLKDKS